MADDPDPLKVIPEQYRERAKLIRRQVETLSNTQVRRQLLDIAKEYEQRANSLERKRRAGC